MLQKIIDWVKSKFKKPEVVVEPVKPAPKTRGRKKKAE
jgi:hypothetical protein